MRRLLPFVVLCAACRGTHVERCTFDAGARPTLIVGAGQWSQVAAPDAPSPPNVLAQEALSAESVFNIALLDLDAASRPDLDLTVKMKPVAGDVDRGGGLVWRARDTRNYYLARWNPREGNLRVYKVVDGVRTQLASTDWKAPAGWHELHVRAVGDSITCELDGKARVDTKDSTLREAGRIGLWTKADARTQFDDLFVR